MWLDKETVGKAPPKAANIESGSPRLGDSTVNILLIGGSRLLQESVTHLLEDTRFSVLKCVENLDQATACLSQNPNSFQMMIFQLVDHNDARFFERLAEIKRTQTNVRTVLLSWPSRNSAFSLIPMNLA